MSLRDKVEGNELDLSLNELDDVPVKELALTPKAIQLDLSCNRIQTLPNDFASLTHLVKIDLSRNKLTELPHNFGNLLNLQHLDLDKNYLKSLPLSFCRLKNLRWLDLKDNPLEPKLKAIAGDCLDEKQCQSCAKKVVTYMQAIESNLEREKQKKLKEMREKEALEKAKLETELENKRRLKKMEKLARQKFRKENMEKQVEQQKENIEKDSDNCVSSDRHDKVLEEKKGLHWCVWFLPLICIFIALAIYILTAAKDSPLHNLTLSDVKNFVIKYSLMLNKTFMKFWKTTFIPAAIRAKASLLKNVHSIMLYISNVASKLELYLSVYF